MCLLFTGIAAAAIPSAYEPDYADAVLALHDGKTADALGHLQAILKQAPEQIESLALEALCYKTLGKTAEARALYEKTIGLQQAAKLPEIAQAPYHFELGVLALQGKNFADADKHLSIALRNQFNVPATHYFLGLTAFQQKEWAIADGHFRNTASANTVSLRPGAFFYLGQLAKRRGDTGRMIHFYNQAERWANTDLEQARTVNDAGRMQTDNQIKAIVAEELGPYRQARWFGQIGLSSGYDSNVLSAPDGTTGASGNGSLRETLLWGLGYTTGQADGVQFVPSYHGSFNYNTNPDTKVGEFLSQTFTLFMNPHVAAPESWGVKAEAQLIFGYADNSASLSPYSLAGSVGPYYRKTLANKWELRGELYAHPQNYFDDDLYASTQARTGWGVTPRLLLQQQTGRGYWNPQAALLMDYTHTDGAEFQSKLGALEVADTLFLDKVWTLDFSGSLGVAVYDNRPGLARTDKLLTLRATATRQITSLFSLSGDIAYLADYTNIDTYRYTRVVTSVALNYLF